MEQIVDLKERTALNTKAILSSAPVFEGQEAKIQAIGHELERMEAELKVLHDQLVDLVAKKR